MSSKKVWFKSSNNIDAGILLVDRDLKRQNIEMVGRRKASTLCVKMKDGKLIERIDIPTDIIRFFYDDPMHIANYEYIKKYASEKLYFDHVDKKDIESEVSELYPKYKVSVKKERCCVDITFETKSQPVSRLTETITLTGNNPYDTISNIISVLKNRNIDSEIDGKQKKKLSEQLKSIIKAELCEKVVKEIGGSIDKNILTLTSPFGTSKASLKLDIPEILPINFSKDTNGDMKFDQNEFDTYKNDCLLSQEKIIVDSLKTLTANIDLDRKSVV